MYLIQTTGAPKVWEPLIYATISFPSVLLRGNNVWALEGRQAGLLCSAEPVRSSYSQDKRRSNRSLSHTEPHTSCLAIWPTNPTLPFPSFLPSCYTFFPQAKRYKEGGGNWNERPPGFLQGTWQATKDGPCAQLNRRNNKGVFYHVWFPRICEVSFFKGQYEIKNNLAFSGANTYSKYRQPWPIREPCKKYVI
jgi:hypothetical protein